jgi:DNA-directed RNA polymerase specialized sigma24 family protein
MGNKVVAQPNNTAVADPDCQATVSKEGSENERYYLEIYHLILKVSGIYFYQFGFGATENFSTHTDIAHQIFTKILRTRYRFRSEAKLETVITKMVRNLYISEWRKLKVRKSYAQEWTRLSEAKQSLSNLHRDTLLKIGVEALADEERLILEGIAEGYSIIEVSKEVGRSRFYVGRALRKILDKLINQLDQ